VIIDLKVDVSCNPNVLPQIISRVMYSSKSDPLDAVGLRIVRISFCLLLLPPQSLPQEGRILLYLDSRSRMTPVRSSSAATSRFQRVRK
jgi:hypothetical protein